ncbi:MAG: hypothetical protein JW797_00890 [Bradymonadales bacterium]|nr:hypothetical protein [Bradymonadales bacterium]
MSDQDRICRAGSYRSAVQPLFTEPTDLLLRREVHEAMVVADNLLCAAEQECQAIQKSARNDGLRQGLREVASLLRQAEQQRMEILRQASQEIIPLALAVARKLVSNRLQAEPGLMVDLVEQTIKEAAGARRLCIRVSPEDLRTVAEALTPPSLPPTEPHLTVVSDGSLKPGDCLVETEIGCIDARIDAQLELILQSLLSTEHQ